MQRRCRKDRVILGGGRAKTAIDREGEEGKKAGMIGKDAKHLIGSIGDRADPHHRRQYQAHQVPAHDQKI